MLFLPSQQRIRRSIPGLPTSPRVLPAMRTATPTADTVAVEDHPRRAETFLEDYDSVNGTAGDQSPKAWRG